MVSLRSGKRTARRSVELQQAETTATPKRTGRAKKEESPEKAVVEEEVVVEKTATTPKRTGRAKKVSEKEESPEKAVVEEEKVVVVEKTTPKTTGKAKKVFEEEESPEEDVPMTESSGEEPEEEVEEEPKEEASEEPEEEEEESDDDDEPMEVTSKKEPSYDIKVAEAPEPVVSIFEQVMAKKAAKSAKDDEKRLKKKSKREARKIAKGVFQVKMKKSKTSFKVVTLKRGVQQALEPANNFRDDLLMARTAKCRMQDSQMVVQRRDWVSKR